MRMDRSDVTSLAVIVLAGGFGVVATGSMAFSATDSARVVVQTSASERGVIVQADIGERIRAEVAERIRTTLAERIEVEADRRTVRPAIYVDGVLVEPASRIRELDPTDVQSVTVLRGRNEIRIESTPR